MEKEFQLHVSQQFKVLVAMNKELCENQSCMLQLLKDFGERQNRLQMKVENLEKAFVKSSSGNEILLSDYDSKSDAEVHIKLGDMSEQISALERRVQELESKLTHADETLLHQDFWASGFRKDEGKLSTDGQSIEEGLDKLESMSMGSWSTASEHEDSFNDTEQRLGKSLKRKGSFKAAFFAIVFVNRLTVTEPANTVTHVHGEETACADEKTGGDHMKAAGLAIIFMLRLLRALQLPLVLDQGMEISPD